MADDAKGQAANTVKDPDDRTTGRETVTGAQASYLGTPCDEADEEFDPSLTKAQASKRIYELQHETGRDKNLRGTSER